jgi:DNA polymerase II small subunit
MKAIIKRFCDHGTFIEPDAINYIASKENPEEFAAFIYDQLREYPLILTLDNIKLIEENNSQTEKSPSTGHLPPSKIREKLLKQLYNPELIIPPSSDEETEDEESEEPESYPEVTPPQNKKTETHPPINTVRGWHPIAKDYSSDFTVIKDVTGNSNCEGTTQDFVRLFRNRYSVLKKIIRNQRREMANVLPINRVKKGLTEVQIIGIVSNVRTTVNGHKLIEIEDETGTIKFMALKNNSETFHLASEVIIDEIVGVIGKFSKNGDLLIANRFIFPDIRLRQQNHHADVPVYAAFLSDIHIGSNMFMETEWNAFLRWINGNIGNSRQRAVASKIKYLILPGDLVDGIGIYPNQEMELEITDIYQQYEKLAQQLTHIPDHITIILQPGNHDAVRPAEPQPTFEKEIQQLFTGKDFKFIGNPCYFTLHGVEILSYHGQSLLDFATNIQSINYNQPTEAMKIMLRKRHLSPVYGGYTPLAPEHTDYMIIDRVPEIFVTGHVHTSSITQYRGVTLINASSWQSQTSYQKMLNFIPDSAKLPIVDLQSGNATTMDFNHQTTE